MTEDNNNKKFPHKHLLGIEGLEPPSINYLIDLSQQFVDKLK